MKEELKDLLRPLYGKLKKLTAPKTVIKTKSGQEVRTDVEAPYGAKVSGSDNMGILLYWKKPEGVDGYEIARSYQKIGKYNPIAKTEAKHKSTYVDAFFDHSRKSVFYRVRSYVIRDGRYYYSHWTKSFEAKYREEIQFSRTDTYLYSGSKRILRAFIGWSELTDAVWSSSNPEVARVSQNGEIEAVATGECTVTCKSMETGKEAVSRVIVNREAPEPLQEPQSRYEWDAEEGIWRNPLSENTGKAVIMMTGDMMCDDLQQKTQYDAETGWNFNDSFEPVKQVTAESDLAIGNLETLLAAARPYAVNESYIDNIYNCNAPSRYLDAVKTGGFDAVITSNNHNCDHGIRALTDTVKEINRYRLIHTGVFVTPEERRFTMIDVNGIRIGLLAYTCSSAGFNGKDRTWTEEEKKKYLHLFRYETASEEIAECRAAGAEYVILYMHWGRKNYRTPVPAQETEAQQAAEAGADLIVGGNPHTVQRYCELKTEDGRTVPCYCSVGNFQTVMDQIPGNRDSLMVRIVLERDGTGRAVLKENGYVPFSCYSKLDGKRWAPVCVSNAYHSEYLRPNRATFEKRIEKAVGPGVKPYRKD